MISVTMGGFTLRVAEAFSKADEPSCAHAVLVARFHTTAENEAYGSDAHVHLHADSGWPTWPFQCVAQHSYPGREAGCYPGILLVPETAMLFIGAGERLLAYDLHGPARLWEDRTFAGFGEWQRHVDLVVMSAELELAAWDLRGVKHWSTFVEPPWEYHMEGGMVYLDVMGGTSSFSLLAGPPQP